MTSTKYPEAEGRALTSYQKQLQTEGYCIIPDVLPAEKSKEALERLWKAAEESRRRGNDTYLARLDPNANNVRVFYLMELDEIFRDLIAHPTAISMVQSLIGEDLLISNFTANIARPGSGSMGLHSDLSLQCPDPWVGPWVLNVIWYLIILDWYKYKTFIRMQVLDRYDLRKRFYAVHSGLSRMDYAVFCTYRC